MSDKYIKLDDVLRKVDETIDFTAQYGVHIGGLRGDISSLPTIEASEDCIICPKCGRKLRTIKYDCNGAWMFYCTQCGCSYERVDKVE